MHAVHSAHDLAAHAAATRYDQSPSAPVTIREFSHLLDKMSALLERNHALEQSVQALHVQMHAMQLEIATLKESQARPATAARAADASDSQPSAAGQAQSVTANQAPPASEPQPAVSEPTALPLKRQSTDVSERIQSIQRQIMETSRLLEQPDGADATQASASAPTDRTTQPRAAQQSSLAALRMP
nr:hypothetical protein HK105_000111 [Polyrhizophydium stewartii]